MMSDEKAREIENELREKKIEIDGTYFSKTCAIAMFFYSIAEDEDIDPVKLTRFCGVLGGLLFDTDSDIKEGIEMLYASKCEEDIKG